MAFALTIAPFSNNIPLGFDITMRPAPSWVMLPANLDNPPPITLLKDVPLFKKV